MNKLEKYNIPFVGLKLGLHHFTYQVNKEFFVAFEDSPISECDIELNLEFLKRENVFELGFNLSGTVSTECDRCTDLLEVQVEDRFQIVMRFRPQRATTANDDPDIIYIERNDTHINIADQIYEFIILSIPMYNVHPDDEDGNSQCNPAVLEWLQPADDDEFDKEQEQNNDEEADQNDDSELNDPRWEALRKLKNKK